MSSCAAAVISNEGRGGGENLEWKGGGGGNLELKGGWGNLELKGGRLWGWLVNNYEGC